MEAVAIGAVGLALVVSWILSSRQHLARRAAQTADWDTGEEQLDLWTSAARCVHCGASGGLLEKEGDRLFFACLACGRRHERENRG